MTDSILAVSTFKNCFLWPPEIVEGKKSLSFGCTEGISNGFERQVCNQIFPIISEIKKGKDETHM